MKFLFVILGSLALTACGGGGGGGDAPTVTPQPPVPAEGTVLETSCNEYTLVEEVADGLGGSTSRETERSPECGWNPPPADTESGDPYCEGFDEYQSYHDGEYGTYSELIQVNSYNCGYEDPVAVFDVVKPVGDRFDPIVVQVTYEQYGEPYYQDGSEESVIVDWSWQESDSTIGRIERPDDDILQIYGDGRLGEGIILLNEEEFTYTIEREPVCAVVDGIDCMGYAASSNISRYAYYGEEDTRMVQWELAVLVWKDEESAGIAGEYNRDSTKWQFWQERVDMYNEVYAKSNIYVEVVLKHVYWGRYDGIESFATIARNEMSDSDVALGYGATPYGTCGVAYGNTSFSRGRPIIGLSRCTEFTDLHEIGHAVGLAHGPENQAYAGNGYTFPEFGHGWNDYCYIKDDIMSYGAQKYLFTNSKQSCSEQFPSLNSDDPAGDRSYRDTAYAINRIRYAVSLINPENDHPTALSSKLQEVTYDSPLIID